MIGFNFSPKPFGSGDTQKIRRDFFATDFSIVFRLCLFFSRLSLYGFFHLFQIFVQAFVRLFRG
ncbi:MAG TPA: hypothetical protein DCE65_09095, partial [Clostridiales bacterium]|nr:hypothetical protein [Clostridiales bacterium]